MTLLEQKEAVDRCVEAVRARWSRTPRVALVLGTGLGGVGSEIAVEMEIPYGDLPGFPAATVESHGGRLLLGEWQGVPVAAMSGRFHRYEGYSLQQVTFPVRVLRVLGASVLFLSGAVGGMNPLWDPGHLVLLDDHINLLGDSPLVGPNVDEWGPRFPDMSEVYDRELQQRAAAAALALGVVLHRGVYVAVTGPSLETRAEYRMLRLLGADVVGMSTVPEALVARQMGMRILALTVITDQCLPDALEPADLQTIIRTAREAEPRLTAVFRSVVAGFREDQ